MRAPRIKTDELGMKETKTDDFLAPEKGGMKREAKMAKRNTKEQKIVVTKLDRDNDEESGMHHEEAEKEDFTPKIHTSSGQGKGN